MYGNMAWKQTQAELDGDTGDDDLICGEEPGAQTDRGCQSAMKWL
jgi:hypothetical protein